MAYFFPGGGSHVFALHKPLMAIEGLSPWAKWTTQHAMGFQPTAVMNAFDPSDGIEYVWMGDASGNVYRMEGTGESGDGGTANIAVERLSPLVEMPLDEKAYDIEGWIRYKKKNVASTVTLTFEYNGHEVFDESITITVPARTLGPVYGGGSYFGGSGVYYGGEFQKRLNRQKFAPPGAAEEWQVRLKTEGTGDIEVEEIGLRMAAAS